MRNGLYLLAVGVCLLAGLWAWQHNRTRLKDTPGSDLTLEKTPAQPTLQDTTKALPLEETQSKTHSILEGTAPQAPPDSQPLGAFGPDTRIEAAPHFEDVPPPPDAPPSYFYFKDNQSEAGGPPPQSYWPPNGANPLDESGGRGVPPKGSPLREEQAPTQNPPPWFENELQPPLPADNQQGDVRDQNTRPLSPQETDEYVPPRGEP